CRDRRLLLAAPLVQEPSTRVGAVSRCTQSRAFCLALVAPAVCLGSRLRRIRWHIRRRSARLVVADRRHSPNHLGQRRCSGCAGRHGSYCLRPSACLTRRSTGRADSCLLLGVRPAGAPVTLHVRARMRPTEALASYLRGLEELLLQPDVRKSARVSELLADG